MVVASLSALPARLMRGRLSRNALFALAQGVLATLTVFLIYRLVMLHAGLEAFGLWSLLMAAASIARLADVSGGGALARFVAAAARAPDPMRARDTIHTVLATGLALNAGLGLLLWLAAPLLLPLFVAPEHLGQARALVPWAIAVSVLTALAYATISAIDGAQRADHRALVVMTAALGFLGASWLLVPRYGIVGFAVAQTLQQAATLVLGWLVLRRHVEGLGWLPRRWRREVCAETTGYALRLNGVGVMGLLFEPLAKLTFNAAGGPALVALFDLAQRLVTQLRLMIVTAAAPLTPAFAARPGPADAQFRSLLEKATKAAALAAVGVAVAALAAAPLVSLLLFDRLVPELLAMNAALTLGWATSMLGVPYYFAGQGLGYLRWNFASQALIAGSVLIAALLVVPTFGAPGLVAAIVAGLIASAVALVLGNAYAFGAMGVVREVRWWLLGAIGAIVIVCSAVWTATGAAGV